MCFHFLAVAATGGRVRSFVRGGEPLLRTRRMIGSCSVCDKALMRQLHSNPIAVSGSDHIFLAVAATGGRVRSFVRSGEPFTPHEGNVRVSRSVCGEDP